MPIKPENKHLYPKNWKQISEQVKKEQNYQCTCGVYHHSVGYRNEDGIFNPTCGNILHDLAGNGLQYPSLNRLSYSQAREIADHNNENILEDEKYIVIVLTTAHLDHDPTNNKRSNLAALCQQCHNRYDAKHRYQTRKQNKYKGMKALFNN